MDKTKLEMHFHTMETSPCGEVPAKRGVEIYQNAGYDGIVVTDHFSRIVSGGPETGTWEEICDKFLTGYRYAREAAKNKKIKIFLGMEIRFLDNDNDYLVYGISEELLKQNPWIYMKGLAELYELAKEKNLLIIQAHPYRKYCQLAPVEFLHGIEVYNGNPRHNSRNELAMTAAKKYGLLQLTGSDFHQEEDISGRFQEINHMPETEQELVNILKANEK